MFALAVAACALLLAAFMHSRLWPLEKESMIRDLEESSDSRVQVRAFHRQYFPHPGCILEGLVFVHTPESPKPLITIDKLTIRSGYFNLLAHRVSHIRAQGMKVFVPVFGTERPFHTQHSNITVAEIVADGATIEFASRNPNKPPLLFDIHEARLRDVGWSGPITYRLAVHNPEPPGEITTGGKFGPWHKNDASETPFSGEYTFEHADLGIYGGIAGTLSSAGKFAGTLGHIDISGTTDTPDFEVASTRHPVRLITQFNAYVDATHGNTFLKRVDAQFRKTHVVAEGSIAKAANGPGKEARIHLTAENGRIEDILGLFVRESRAPMSGTVTLRAEVEIPPGERPFLEKVKLRGNFGIGPGEFSRPSTQEGVNKLSAGASGERNKDDPETVLTDLTGKVALENAVANFSDLSFGVPGVAARLEGTYNVISHRIDLHGQIQVDTKISQTTSGPKAFLLKVMDPFFKKREKGEVLPVKITGTYEKPSFGLDLNDPKAKVPLPAPR